MTVLSVIDGLDPQTDVSTIKRLNSGNKLVYDVMHKAALSPNEQDRWVTLYQLRIAVNNHPDCKETYSESCISARIRDQRKPKHGGHTVLKRIVAGKRNLWEYKLVLEEDQDDFGPEAA